MLAGTPFRGMLLRAMGVKVGAKLFDSSKWITERPLTEIGDHVNLNEGVVLEAHSLEEGVFKSDHIQLGNRCSVGPGALVHYGVSTGDHVVLDADSFLMKGEDPRLSYWVVRKSGHVGTPHAGWLRFASRTLPTLPTLPSETSSSRGEDVVFQRNDKLCQAQESDR